MGGAKWRRFFLLNIRGYFLIPAPTVQALKALISAKIVSEQC